MSRLGRSAVYLQDSKCLSRDSDCTWPCWGRRFAAKMWPPPAPDGGNAAGPPPPAPDGSVPHRTSTASSKWQCFALDLNRRIPMTVFSTRPQPPALDGSAPFTGPHRIRPQPPDPDGSVPRMAVFPTGPPF